MVKNLHTGTVINLIKCANNFHALVPFIKPIINSIAFKLDEPSNFMFSTNI